MKAAYYFLEAAKEKGFTDADGIEVELFAR